MKKMTIVVGLILSISMIVLGCSAKQTYTKEEEVYIELANNVISEKYDVNINKGDYNYSVGKQSSENQFDKIAEGEKPEIISVHALSKKLPKEGDMLEYTLIYNTKTKAIIKSDMYLQSEEDTKKAE